MAERRRVAADVVHEVAVRHGPVHTYGGLVHAVGVGAIAHELWFVDKDGVIDGAEEGQVPRVLGAGNGAGEAGQGAVGFLLGHEGSGSGEAVEEGGLDAGVEEGKVVGREELVLVGKGVRDADLAGALTGIGGGGEEKEEKWYQ